MRLIISWLINTVVLVFVSAIIPGIYVQDILVAMFAALILALFNTFLKPFILLITLPINLLSLGIFTLFINGFLFYLVSKVVGGFVVTGFWSAFWGALLFSIVNIFIHIFVNPWKKIKINYYTSDNRSRDYKEVIDAEIIEEDRKHHKLNEENK